MPRLSSSFKVVAELLRHFGIAAIERLYVGGMFPRRAGQKRSSRIRDLGIATAQTAVVIGTVGLLGAGYYGYHRSTTGGAIQRLVPEWEVQRETLVAQAGPWMAPPTCTQDPPSRQGGRITLPGLQVDQPLPLSGAMCAAWAMPGGALGLALRARGDAMGTNFVGQTCLEHNRTDLQASARVRLCYLTIEGSGRGYTDFFKHSCKKCVNPPARSCTGLMCSMGTRAVDLGLTPGAEFSVDKSVAGFTFAAKIRIEVPGLNIRGGVHTTRNGTDPQCGDCSREVIDGVSGVARPDCDRVTVHWPFGAGLAVSGGGDARAGPLSARLRIRGGLEGNVRYLNESGACVQGNARACLLGGFSMWGGWDVRAGVNAFGATIARVDCRVTWTANDCSRNRRHAKTGNCEDPVYPRVNIAGIRFPF